MTILVRIIIGWTSLAATYMSAHAALLAAVSVATGIAPSPPPLLALSASYQCNFQPTCAINEKPLSELRATFSQAVIES